MDNTSLHLNADHLARVQSSDNSRFPENVGILAMDIYFPRTYVNQTRLEEFSKVSAGKFTIGLGQDNLSFVTDREDIYSLCLTVVASLMEKYNIRYEDIGRLEVATETIIDHSKSVKSVLMQLFEESGNTDVEGVDTIHACYAGTNALFNSVQWIESSAWDGRYALVVTGDIAEYATGPARPTGGAGAVAMLIGPNAPFVLERGLRSSHMEHAYDFYKPRLDSPYPVVDGHFSNLCYLKSLDLCFDRLKTKAQKLRGEKLNADSFDHCIFHSPYNKLVQKSFARLYYNDFLETPENPMFQGLESLKEISLEESYDSRDIQKAFGNISKKQYVSKVGPTTVIPKNIGNMYSASLYASFVSLVAEQGEKLVGNRILMFSYGSGLASSMFSIRVSSNGDDSLKRIAALLDVQNRFNDRIECTPETFAETMLQREELHKIDSFEPSGDLSTLFPGTFYLTRKDEMCRRFYQRV
eukprot:TRINITY_DN4505_c0_g1_i1.p1 TRINITY_DN4505_c0_g1~~TRINITY_DN4505_c0_g1_i1.p1  ORF type:complete len:495 (-),score=139.04 TRINITY_DN4505_c0_g1_i1:108-1514(-)